MKSYSLSFPPIFALFLFLLCYPKANAAKPVATIGDISYSTLAEAFDAAQDGDTVALLEDVIVSESITLTKAITFDGNGFALHLEGRNTTFSILSNAVVQNLDFITERNTNATTFLLSGNDLEITLKDISFSFTAARPSGRTPAGIQCSLSSSALQLEDVSINSTVNMFNAIQFIGDCSDSVIRITRTNITVTPADKPRSCFGVILRAENSPREISLDDCTITVPTACIAADENSSTTAFTLSNCDLQAAAPLYISGSNGIYAFDHCTLVGSDDPGQIRGLVALSDTATQNQITLSDSEFICPDIGSPIAVFSAWNTENQITVGQSSAIQVQTEQVSLFELGRTLSITPLAEIDDTVSCAFPVVVFNANGSIRNACTASSAAATIWQPDDTITLTGAHFGALEITVPVTIQGDGASFSGSIAIRTPDASIQSMDLSNATIDAVPDCNLSLNYWGTQPRPPSAKTSPYYTDPDLTELTYEQVSDDQALQILYAFVSDVTNIVQAYLPGISLSSFDSETHGAQIRPSADALIQLCVNLGQTTSAQQRADILNQDTALAQEMSHCWRVYWSAVHPQITDSIIEISPALLGGGSDLIKHAITENMAVRKPLQNLSTDGTRIPRQTAFHAHSTLVGWSFNTWGQPTQLTFETELHQQEETPIPGSFTFRLPIPSQNCTAVSYAVNGQVYPASVETESPYLFITVPYGNHVEISMEYAPAPEIPETPEIPEAPKPTLPPAPIPEVSLSLSNSSHGQLFARPNHPKVNDLVCVQAIPDHNYRLDGFEVIDQYGNALAFDQTGNQIYFTMPQRNVRVSAYFIREADQMPTPRPERPDSPDLPSNPSYDDDILIAIQSGWISSNLSGIASAQIPMTRGELIEALYQISGRPHAFAVPFTDTPVQTPYYSAAIWARASGIIVGEPNGTLRPYDAITRQECLTILWRLQGKPLTPHTVSLPFSDAQAISDWAKPAMQWAYLQGILRGNTEGTCTPHALVTRAQTAALLVRYANTTMRSFDRFPLP